MSKYCGRRGGHFRTPPPPPPGSPGGPGEGWNGSRFGWRGSREYRRDPSRGPLYRSRRGKIMGVCRGLAEHFGISVFWLRFFTVLLAVFTGFWPVVFLYLIAGAFMKPEPVAPFEEEGEKQFYTEYTSSRTMAMDRLKRKFEDLDKRIRKMEDRVTSREFDWDRRFHQES